MSNKCMNDDQFHKTKQNVKSNKVFGLLYCQKSLKVIYVVTIEAETGRRYTEVLGGVNLTLFVNI